MDIEQKAIQYFIINGCIPGECPYEFSKEIRCDECPVKLAIMAAYKKGFKDCYQLI